MSAEIASPAPPSPCCELRRRVWAPPSGRASAPRCSVRAGGTTGGWPTAGFAQRPSRGADGNSIDVPAASAAILAAVAVGGVVAAALCLLCFRSGLGGRRAKQKHRTGSSEERTALTAVLEIPVV